MKKIIIILLLLIIIIIEIQHMWNVKEENNTGNKRGKWNHFKISQTIPEQHTGKARD
jgi:hypothetical protein